MVFFCCFMTMKQQKSTAAVIKRSLNIRHGSVSSWCSRRSSWWHQPNDFGGGHELMMSQPWPTPKNRFVGHDAHKSSPHRRLSISERWAIDWCTLLHHHGGFLKEIHHKHHHRGVMVGQGNGGFGKYGASPAPLSKKVLHSRHAHGCGACLLWGTFLK